MNSASDQVVRQSLITRSGAALVVLVFISVVNMVVTFLSAENAENDAVRINIAGSLRMQSYRIAETLILSRQSIDHGDTTLEERLAEFERRLYLPVLARHIRNSGNEASVDAYAKLERQWFSLKRLMLAPDSDLVSVLDKIDAFVLDIDNIVKMLEVQTESKLKLLRILQGISMLVTIIVVTIVFLDLTNTVVMPLRRLVAMANRVRGGDFSMRINVGREDELALLSDTFNTMAASLDAMYRELEDKVQEKTRHLERARDELSLLYETARLLSGGENIQLRLQRVLDHAQRYLDPAQLAVELKGSVVTGDRGLVAPPTPGDGLPDTAAHRHRFAIERPGDHFGELVVAAQRELSAQQRRTVQLVAGNIASAVGAELRREQQHRLVLMEERAVIARELHDSLAQTLSYLKIQISRLQMQQARQTAQPQLDETVEHIREGINAAYVQLRELLGTFRLQLSSQGLRAALQATVAEFSERGDIAIGLDYRLDDCPLSPNEEIHVLQIVREALSNVLRHSGAGRAQIEAAMAADRTIEVCVTDDGKGFGPSDAQENHYGKIIMRERARSLKGEIGFDNAAGGGARVTLRFVPHAIARAHRMTPQPSVGSAREI
ncbi:MAG: type IV pili methyl-accepting chemotaxis transducer N-terminal domain-containing protein [Halioglobus sp.]|nr:type IV pili methyl-accepting chemotaxis transducer N-terminal domain-containing protein [Halioglobus sp.]